MALAFTPFLEKLPRVFIEHPHDPRPAPIKNTFLTVIVAAPRGGADPPPGASGGRSEPPDPLVSCHHRGSRGWLWGRAVVGEAVRSWSGGGSGRQRRPRGSAWKPGLGGPFQTCWTGMASVLLLDARLQLVPGVIPQVTSRTATTPRFLGRREIRPDLAAAGVRR